MPGYIEPPLETDPDELAAEAIAYLIDNLQGWEPQEGHLEVWWIEALARMVAEARDVASAVPTSIYRTFGQSLLALLPIDAAPARTASTWTMVDALGYTIEAETLVAFRVAGDELVVFRVESDVVVPPGSLATAAGEVVLVAFEEGTAANGIPAGPMELVDDLAFVDSVVATSPVTAGGVDAESDDTYLDRLREELRLSSPRPILPTDFAVIAKRIAGVHRAVSIDGWNPNTATGNNARTISVAVVDADGQPVAAGPKADLEALLESMREVNWLVFVIDPSYTAIDVTFTAVSKVGYDAADVEARAEQAVRDYFAPSRWGGGDEDPPVWRHETVVRYGEVWSLIDGVEGVDYVDTLAVEGGVVNVNLAGVAPLTTAGVIDGTVT